MQALGTVETVGLTAAFEAADVACKTANVELVGYELAKGGGYVTIKVIGNVGAVQAAVAAAASAAERISRVVSTLVIPRPSEALEALVHNSNTKGYEPPNAPAGDQDPDSAATRRAPQKKTSAGQQPVDAAQPKATQPTTRTTTKRKQS